MLTSDNGGMEQVPGEIITDNYPLDRGKINAKEGGVRVPFIVVGPNIPKAKKSEVMVNGLDFYPPFFPGRVQKNQRDKIWMVRICPRCFLKIQKMEIW